MLELHYPTVTKTILERQYPGKPTLKVAFGNGNGAIFENSSKLRASLFVTSRWPRSTNKLPSSPPPAGCDRERRKMSKFAGKKPKEKSDKTKADNFVWTDDEVQLLLEVTNDYKVSEAAKNIDWESCQSKYTDILELYREHHPSCQEESSEIEKEYPSDVSVFTAFTKIYVYGRPHEDA